MPTKSITFHCEVITPMFIGNAMPGEAELRPSTIKGALRFWWRAMNGSLPIEDRDANGNPQNCLRTTEAEIFGSADEKIGRSKFSITTSQLTSTNTPFDPDPVIQRKINKERDAAGNMIRYENRSASILKYLAFGKVVGNDFSYYLKEGLPFSIEIGFSNPMHYNEIEKSLVVCSIFGGFGGKNRNGFGRFKILQKNNQPFVYPKIETIFRAYRLDNFKAKLLPNSYTSFSSKMRLFKVAKSELNYNQILFELGKRYLGARVNYWDHSAKTTNGIEEERKYFKRPYLGSPVLAGRIEKKPAVSGVSAPITRHAKTHFWGINKENGQFFGYILFLPYKYLSTLKDENGNLLSNQIGFEQAYNQNTADFNDSLKKQSMKEI
jgi:CRISPR-associated protein Cmr1